MHLKSTPLSQIKSRWVRQTYYSSFHSKSRGVAILFHKSIPFVCSKVLSDPNGRYLKVTGSLYGTQLILVNVYAPNWDDTEFFKKLFSALLDMSSHLLILGGDFNCWLNPDLDRSSSKAAALSKSAKVIKDFMENFSISDPWRFFNPTSKAFSFFSPAHRTFTRLDYFLLDNRFLPCLTPTSCSHEPMVISDHSPVVLNIRFKGLV